MPHTWRKSVFLSVYTCTYMHCGHSLTALLCMWCVLGTAHLCVYPAQWCLLLFRPSGAVSPATAPTCQLPVPPPPLPLPMSLSLSFSLSLWADEWSPGDEVTVVVTAQFLFLSPDIWKVLYFARDTVRWRRSVQSLMVTLLCYYKTNTAVLSFNHISIDVLWNLCEAAGYSALCLNDFVVIHVKDSEKVLPCCQPAAWWLWHIFSSSVYATRLRIKKTFFAHRKGRAHNFFSDSSLSRTEYNADTRLCYV